MIEARRFPRGCVASPHHLASSAGIAVLASGGNALDAAVAANLTLGVVTPYLCGFGGDLFDKRHGRMDLRFGASGQPNPNLSGAQRRFSLCSFSGRERIESRVL